MNKKHLVGLLLLGCSISISAADAVVHAKVQHALDWELPAIECTKPKVRGAGISVVNGAGDRKQASVDSYTIEREGRKMKRWNTCVTAYKEKLSSDFETLRSSAQYGLTQAQAKTIMGKMKLIQSTILSFVD